MRSPTLIPMLGAAFLLASAVFCAQGFLATFEPTEDAANFATFRAAYAICGATSLLAALAVLTRLVHGRPAARAAGPG